MCWWHFLAFYFLHLVSNISLHFIMQLCGYTKYYFRIHYDVKQTYFLPVFHENFSFVTASLMFVVLWIMNIDNPVQKKKKKINLQLKMKNCWDTHFFSNGVRVNFAAPLSNSAEGIACENLFINIQRGNMCTSVLLVKCNFGTTCLLCIISMMI